MADEKHPIRNGIVVTVVGAFVLWLLGTWFPGAWPSVWEWVKWAGSGIWKGVTYSVSLPVWLISLLSLLALVTIVRIIASFRSAESKQYVEDMFFGVRWRWSWHSGVPDVRMIAPYCPNDDTLLVHSSWMHETRLSCETCGSEFGPLDGDYRFVQGTVARQIDRKLRSGEWNKSG